MKKTGALLLLAAAASGEQLTVTFCSDDACSESCSSSSGESGVCIALEGTDLSMKNTVVGAGVKTEFFLGNACSVGVKEVTSAVDTCLPASNFDLSGSYTIKKSSAARMMNQTEAKKPLKLTRTAQMSAIFCQDAQCSADCTTLSGSEGECLRVGQTEFSMKNFLTGDKVKTEMFSGADCQSLFTTLESATDTCLPGSSLPLPGLANSYKVSVNGMKLRITAPAPITKTDMSAVFCQDAHCSTDCTTLSGSEGQCLRVGQTEFSMKNFLTGSKVKTEMFSGADCQSLFTTLESAIDTCLPGSSLPLPGLANSYKVSVNGMKLRAAPPAPIDITRRTDMSAKFCKDTHCSTDCTTLSGSEGQCLRVGQTEFSMKNFLTGSKVKTEMFSGADCQSLFTTLESAIDTCLPGSSLPLPGLADSYIVSVNGAEMRH